MFNYKELCIEIETLPRPRWQVSLGRWLRAVAKSIFRWRLRPPPTRLAGYYLIRDSAQEQPVGIIRRERWAKKWCRRRSVVRRCSDNQVVMMLYRWAPGLSRPFQGVCIYDWNDRLSGYCFGDFKMPFKEGFKVV